ncbi:MAG: TRZ/ATZ family hydrolase [Gammaproteobacteria bacterium]
MEHVDTLLHARWIIPVEPDNTVHGHHSLAVKDDRIHALLPTDEARRRYRADVELDLPDHALIPGLINAHTHAAMSLFRGLADDLPLMEWLNNHVWPAEGAWVNPAFVRDGTQLAMAEMLKGGVTCFNDMYFFPDETAQVVHEAGMRAMVGMILIDFPTAWAQNAEEYLDKGLKLHDHYRNHPLIATAFAPHAPYTVSDDPLERVRVLADELDVPIHMHVHETAAEVQQGVDAHGIRPLQRLDRLGLTTPRLLGVHMTQLSDAEIAAYARSGAHVVHCPESNLKLASGFCPVHKLLQAGINVALGTDGAASNNDLDRFAEMRGAALLGKAVAQDASALPAHLALRMAPLNGAAALGLAEETGSLVAGKAADLAAVHLGAIETQPLYHPISQLVYAGVRHLVSDVWVAGQHLVKKGVLTTLDEQDILAKAQAWQQKIRKFD